MLENSIKRKQRWRHKRSSKSKTYKTYKSLKKINPKKLFLFIFLIFVYFSLFKKSKFPFIKLISKEKHNQNQNQNIKEAKVGMCSLGKQENLYVREFVEHYKNYGVKKIYLYDTNDINGERFEEVIDDYIKSGFVEVNDWRGKFKVQFKILNVCYKAHKDEYDWIMFTDLDEYIHLYNNYTKVGEFLAEPKFNQCEIVYLNLICHSDNEHLYYENKPLKERFPNVVPSDMFGGKNLEIKFILKGHMENVSIYCLHRGNMGIKNNCNGFGHKDKYKSIYTTEPDTMYYYYDHYYSKSTEEFVKKIVRGDNENYHNQFRMGRIKKYFQENTLTLEKVLMIENGTKLDLSSYKNQIKK